MILFLLFNFFAHAEYQAYELELTKQETKASRRVTSTLDPIQYPIYYPLEKGETVQLIKSWRCRGSTANFKPVCSSH